MKEQLTHWQQKIDQLNQRERMLVLLVLVAGVVMVLQWLVLDPLLKEHTIISDKIARITDNMQRQKNEQLVLQAQLSAGVNRESIKRRDQLQALRDKLDQQIKTSVVTMIAPTLMPKVLEDILSQDDNLTLLSLEDRPAVPIFEHKKDNAKTAENQRVPAKTADDPTQALYKHAFVLRLQGTYPATIAYFEKLSALPWRFHWQDLIYQVTEYPHATITLEVYTVSMSQEWLGV